ncbi:MAG TPA: tetratricopeptide repeat protein [Symbiobacteriaceae bacterium]|nr:tetratricopeptide repeat protein [Symbiobacteriaceae bacterium]
MLEQIAEWERFCQWAEVRRHGHALLCDLQGVQRARLHAALSVAYFNTATGAADWREALYHAHACCDHAPVGSMLHTWGLYQVGTLAVDTSRTQEAKRYVTAFLKVVPQHPQLQGFVPRAIRDLSHVAYQERRFADAAALRRRALALFQSAGDEPETFRTALNLVWAYVRAGRPAAARQALPESVPAGMEHLRHGALAAVLAAEGRWSEALEQGRAALRAPRLAYDFADAAEICLIMAMAARHVGAMRQALAYIHEAALLAARQDRSALALMVLTIRAEGGDSSEEAASLGSGGWHPDARFTTGLG